MLAGLKQNPDQLAKRGLDAEFVSTYEATYNDTQILDNEQEKLKAEQKAKTEAVKQRLKNLADLYSEAKKIVKIEMPATSWSEFGIENKR